MSPPLAHTPKKSPGAMQLAAGAIRRHIANVINIEFLNRTQV